MTPKPITRLESLEVRPKRSRGETRPMARSRAPSSPRLHVRSVARTVVAALVLAGAFPPAAAGAAEKVSLRRVSRDPYLGAKHYPHPRAPSRRSHGSKMPAIGLTMADALARALWRVPRAGLNHMRTCVRAANALSPGCRARCCALGMTRMGILWSLPSGRWLTESCRALPIRTDLG
jgi:hypothetical protein